MQVTNTAAAANNGKYVSEVYVAYGKDADEAKKTLEDKGFTPVEGNLNDGGKTYARYGCFENESRTPFSPLILA